MEKKLYRVMKDKMLCGVCTGLAQYFGIDATLVRLAFVLLGLFGPGILAYIIAALIIPEEPAPFVEN